MARQEVLFAETISGIKRALNRKDDGSDIDGMGEPVTNRGNKLKRKAAFTRQGRLDNAENYKRKITFYGYERTVVSRKPPRLDADGDVVDEDDESDPDLTPADDDAYGEIRIENILMPLTHASELRDHPSLSLPYTSRAIDQLIQNAQEMLIKEQEALWQLKKLSNEFRGDQTWVPCEVMQTENDLALVGQAASELSTGVIPDTLPNTDDTNAPEPMDESDIPMPLDEVPDGHGEAAEQAVPMDEDTIVHEADTNGIKEENETVGTTSIPEDEGAKPPVIDQALETTQSASTAIHQDVSSTTEDVTMEDSTQEPPPNDAQSQHHQPPNDEPIPTSTDNITLPTDPNPDQPTTASDPENPSAADAEIAHPMTTRTRARASAHAAPSSPLSPPTATATATPLFSPTHPSSPTHPIHPLFLPPASSHPSRDLGLPGPEADDTRRLLYAYVQRQEEVVRGVERLWLGLLKARRMREMVGEWCAAEGHVGEMSDGEDWVEVGRWGLEEGELGKGEEEGEEEEGQGKVAGKKTRGRKEKEGVGKV